MVCVKEVLEAWLFSSSRSLYIYTTHKCNVNNYFINKQSNTHTSQSLLSSRKRRICMCLCRNFRRSISGQSECCPFLMRRRSTVNRARIYVIRFLHVSRGIPVSLLSCRHAFSFRVAKRKSGCSLSYNCGNVLYASNNFRSLSKVYKETKDGKNT